MERTRPGLNADHQYVHVHPRDTVVTATVRFAIVPLVSAVLVVACANAPAGSPSGSVGSPPVVTPGPTTSGAPALTPAIALFRSPVSVALGGDPAGAVVADMDGDGHVDIVTINGAGLVTVLRGLGMGTFTVATTTPVGTGPVDMALADLNGDGRLDVVLAHTGVTDMGTGPDDIVVLLANPDGSLRKLAPRVGSNAQAVVVADFDRDNVPDIATANDGDHVSVYRGHGDGTFDDPRSFAIGATFSSGIRAADFNRDGNLDLVTADSLIGRGRSDQTVSVLLGHGDGTFGSPNVLRVGGIQPTMPVVADLNGDGFLDVSTPNGGGDSDLSVLLGHGDGSFAKSVEYPTWQYPHTLVAADMDGDGHLDLIAGADGLEGGPVERGLSVLFGRGDGTFEPTVDVANEGFGNDIAAIADFDGDGRIDLLLGNAGSLTIMFNAVDR
jgi:hypothetical protein